MDSLQLVEIINIFFTFLGEAIVFFACTEKVPKRKYVILIVGLKMLFVNFIFVSIMGPIYGNFTWYRSANVLINVVTQLLFTYFVKTCAELSWSKYSMVIIFAEMITLCVTFVPAVLIARFSHQQLVLVLEENIGGYHFLHWGVVLCLQALLLRYGKHWFSYVRNRKIEHPTFWIIILIGYHLLGLWLCIKSSYVTRDNRHEGKMIVFTYPFFYTGVAVIVILLFYFIFLKMTNRQLALENENLKMQRNMIQEYYQSLQLQVELIRKFRHDIANHLQTIEMLLELPSVRTQEISEYEETLKKEHERLQTMDYCSNQVIDAAISNKVRFCKKNDIPIQIMMSGLKLDKIKELDFLGLLFNLLDNAIESCIKIEDKESRYIELECFQVAGQLVLLMKNSFLEVIERNYKLITTKKDTKYHGVGMSIVTDIVKKYDGDMDITFDKNDFCVRINMSNS